MVNPRSVRRDRKPLGVRAIVLFAIVVVGALVFWLLRPSPDTPNTAITTTSAAVAFAGCRRRRPRRPGPALEPASSGLPLRGLQTGRTAERRTGKAQLRKELRPGRPAVVDVHVGARQGRAGWDFRRHRWRLQRRELPWQAPAGAGAPGVAAGAGTVWLAAGLGVV
jgi:hypothetical protein